MLGLLNKLTDQIFVKKPPQGPQQLLSSGLLHKVTDAVSKQKHPQDYQDQPGAQMFPYGGGPGYSQPGYILLLFASSKSVELTRCCRRI